MDMISDMLTSIRNAITKKKEKVDVPNSNIKRSIAKILKDEGFISNYKIITNKGDKKGILRVLLKYTPERTSVITGLKKISKPGLRVYKSYKEIPKIRAAFGITILSTPKGLLTDNQARKEKIGGEVLCQVW
jgi:small subunit ribosomal protein S8